MPPLRARRRRWCKGSRGAYVRAVRACVSVCAEALAHSRRDACGVSRPTREASAPCSLYLFCRAAGAARHVFGFPPGARASAGPPRRCVSGSCGVCSLWQRLRESLDSRLCGLRHCAGDSAMSHSRALSCLGCDVVCDADTAAALGSWRGLGRTCALSGSAECCVPVGFSFRSGFGGTFAKSERPCYGTCSSFRTSRVT